MRLATGRWAHPLLLSLALAVSAAVVAAGAGTTMAAPPAEPAQEPSLSFSPSGLEGGGFINTVALDPAGSGLVLAGGDVSGVHRSTDWGRTWSPANTGITVQAHLKVAALAFSPTVPNKVYAAVGARGTQGGLLVSTDGGTTWSLRSHVPRFSGGNNVDAGLPTTHPRSTGNLLVVDDERGLLYAGTFDDGVMRSADDGHTWTTLDLSGKHVRSLVFSAAEPDVLYASVYGDRIYKTTSARGDGSFVPLASSPASVEELLVLGDALYAAAGHAGVFRSRDDGATWERLGDPVVRNDGPVWMAIAGYLDAEGTAVLYAGADQPSFSGAAHDSVVRSRDGGETWSSVTADPAAVHPDVGGPGGEPWWLALSRPVNLIGGRQFTAAHLAVTGTDPDRIFVAGRSGVWATPDATSSWYPMVRGMGVTINRTVVADPNAAGRVFVGNTDWVVLTSGDGLDHVIHTPPSLAQTAYSLALDTTEAPSTVYVAVSGGEIYSSTEPGAGVRWVAEGLKKATRGKQAVAVAVGRSVGTRAVLAAVKRSGIWRKVGSKWSRVSTGPMQSKGENASFAWIPGSSVFLFDAATGLWRSNDDGRTWTLIWRPGRTTMTPAVVVADPTDPGLVYVSAFDGVYRLDGADSGTVGTGISPVRVADVRPGPIAVGGNGALFVAEPAVRGAGPTVAVSVDGGKTVRRLDDEVYRAAALFPRSLSVGPDGRVYVALDGTGAIVGTPTGEE